MYWFLDSYMYFIYSNGLSHALRNNPNWALPRWVARIPRWTTRSSLLVAWIGCIGVAPIRPPHQQMQTTHEHLALQAHQAFRTGIPWMFARLLHPPKGPNGPSGPKGPRAKSGPKGRKGPRMSSRWSCHGTLGCEATELSTSRCCRVESLTGFSTWSRWTPHVATPHSLSSKHANGPFSYPLNTPPVIYTSYSSSPPSLLLHFRYSFSFDVFLFNTLLLSFHFCFIGVFGVQHIVHGSGNSFSCPKCQANRKWKICLLGITQVPPKRDISPEKANISPENFKWRGKFSKTWKSFFRSILGLSSSKLRTKRKIAVKFDKHPKFLLGTVLFNEIFLHLPINRRKILEKLHILPNQTIFMPFPCPTLALLPPFLQ